MEIIRSCNHSSSSIDQKEGIEVCLVCGLVLSSFVFEEAKYVQNERDGIFRKWEEKAKDILDRINMPTKFAEETVSYLFQNFPLKSNQNFLFSLYYIVNEKYGFPITLKDLSAVSNCSQKKLYAQQPENEFVTLEIDLLIERFCKLLAIPFQTTTLIKEFVKKQKISGHAPLTVIASSIYYICKKQGIKLTIKKVSKVTAISPISMQRYLKKC